MSKLVITRWKDRLLTALFSGKDAVELGLEGNASILGNIYIGKVKQIVKNLNSAFVDFSEGCTGYYSLTDNPSHLFTGAHTGHLKAGDEIIVQVAKEAVKTKDPVLTSNLNFTGKYAVLTAGKTMTGFSSRIGDRAWKDQIRPRLEALTGGRCGVIVRTNAYQQEDALLRETALLMERYEEVLQKAPYRLLYSLLYEAEPEYVKTIRSCPAGSLEEIITDQEEVFESLPAFLKLYDLDSSCGLRFYCDPMLRLSSLYSLETILDQATQKRVWLKSGGYLVIEHTEAMVVIDVNTGKYSGKKTLDETLLMINLEAAKEISRQLRLRNLSGIIMVDFIDMKREADKALLMETLRRHVLPDPVKTTVVDMTPLNLVELTRKKEKKPLWEQLYDVQNKR